MPQPVTLAEMRTAIREIADEEEIQQDRISQPELDRRINRALRSLYNKLVRAGGHERYVKEHQIVTVVGVDRYPLPGDFGVHLLGVLGQDGNLWADLATWSHNDLAYLEASYGTAGADSLRAQRYRIQGQELVLKPTPRKLHTLHLRYVPQFLPLAGDTDSFDGVNGWEEWAYLTVAIGLLSKDEQDPSELRRQLAMIDAEIDSLAGNRDAGQPEVVQDTRQDGWVYGTGYDDWNA